MTRRYPSDVQNEGWAEIFRSQLPLNAPADERTDPSSWVKRFYVADLALALLLHPESGVGQYEMDTNFWFWGPPPQDIHNIHPLIHINPREASMYTPRAVYMRFWSDNPNWVVTAQRVSRAICERGSSFRFINGLGVEGFQPYAYAETAAKLTAHVLYASESAEEGNRSLYYVYMEWLPSVVPFMLFWLDTLRESSPVIDNFIFNPTNPITETLFSDAWEAYKRHRAAMEERGLHTAFGFTEDEDDE